jgi:beta-glucosidase
MDTPTPESLLASMSLEEKVAQLVSVKPYQIVDEANQLAPEKADLHLRHGIGQISAPAGTLRVSPSQAAALNQQIQAYLRKQTRLGIPAIVHEECLSGFCANGATVFPQAIGLASTWEPALLEEMTALIREQMRAVGARHALAPVLDIIRDPRWGRCEETFGEDSFLVTEMGKAYIRGLQGQDLREGIAATAKHFAAHALSEGGRNCAPVHVGPRELRDVFFAPFEAAVKEAKVRTVMNAYHDIDGLPCTSSRELLTGILREEWGFQGAVVSDYFAVERLISQHHTAADKQDAACQALEAGIDLELPFADCYNELLAAVQSGRLAEATLDQAVLRMLRFKQDLGLLDDSQVPAPAIEAVYASPETHEVSRRIAQKTMVLLKNDLDLLPLPKDLKSIAVIGPNADSRRNMLGDYNYNVTLSAALRLELADTQEALQDFGGVRISSVLEGIRGAVSAGTEVRYAHGCGLFESSEQELQEAVVAAQGADAAVLVLGDQAGMFLDGTSGENIDRVDATLTGAQIELLRRVAATGTPIVVVMLNGRPLVIPEVAHMAQAVLEAWHPGEAGGQVVADVLFGDFNPGGKLPVSLLAATGQAPLTYQLKPVSYKDYLEGPFKPVYAFGHGLSYSRFAYHDLHISPERLEGDGAITVSCVLENVGQRAGEEVVQLYIHDVLASLTRPVMQLKGFQRVALLPGEAQTVTFTLPLKALSFHDQALRKVVEPGRFEVMVGAASDDVRLRGEFEVMGKVRVLAIGREL